MFFITFDVCVCVCRLLDTTKQSLTIKKGLYFPDEPNGSEKLKNCKNKWGKYSIWFDLLFFFSSPNSNLTTERFTFVYLLLHLRDLVFFSFAFVYFWTYFYIQICILLLEEDTMLFNLQMFVQQNFIIRSSLFIYSHWECSDKRKKDWKKEIGNLGINKLLE